MRRNLTEGYSEWKRGKVISYSASKRELQLALNESHILASVYLSLYKTCSKFGTALLYTRVMIAFLMCVA